MYILHLHVAFDAIIIFLNYHNSTQNVKISNESIFMNLNIDQRILRKNMSNALNNAKTKSFIIFAQHNFYLLKFR